MKQEVIAHTNMPANRINVIPIGTDIRRFDPSLYDQTITRGRFNIPLNKFVIGVLGRLDPQKGHEEFIRTIPSLLVHRDELHFIIAGDETSGEGGFKRRLIELIRELGISDYVQFLPFTNAVPEFMSAIDLFVLPSHCETFGFVLVEAMMMEKTIIATNAGGVPEIITNYSTGLLVPPKNVPALSEALLKLLNDQNLRLIISTEARIDALKRFDITRTVDQLVVSLDSL
jgi:glycosyltransferase involved in cell wall biosynthesis